MEVEPGQAAGCDVACDPDHDDLEPPRGDQVDVEFDSMSCSPT